MPLADPRRDPARTAALTGLVSDAGVRGRAFVDATGTPVLLPRPVRRVVATDEVVGALVAGFGTALVGCAGTVDGVEQVGTSRSPDPAAVAALRPDVVVTSAVDRVHDLADPRLVVALQRIAPVIAVEAGRPAAALADLRALIGPLASP